MLLTFVLVAVVLLALQIALTAQAARKAREQRGRALNAAAADVAHLRKLFDDGSGMLGSLREENWGLRAQVAAQQERLATLDSTIRVLNRALLTCRDSRGRDEQRPPD